MSALSPNRVGPALAILALSTASCLYDLPDPIPGQRWENTATGATGKIDGIPVLILNSEGDPVHEGWCYCNSDHALMASVAAGLTDPVPRTDEIAEYVASRTVYWCKKAAEDLGLDPGTDDCEDAVAADGFPHHVGDCTIYPPPGFSCGPVDPGETGGTGETTGDGDGDGDGDGGFTPLDELSLHVDCSSSTACDVTETLVDYALTNPDQIMLSGGVIAEKMSPTGGLIGYEFTSVPTGSLAETLGFQVGDVVTHVHGISVASAGDWLSIFGRLVGATSTTVTRQRGAATQTITFTQVP